MKQEHIILLIVIAFIVYSISKKKVSKVIKQRPIKKEIKGIKKEINELKKLHKKSKGQ